MDVLGDERQMNAPRRSPALLLLAVILALEFLLLAAASVFLIIELIVEVPVSYPSAIALLVLALVATAWLAALTVNLLRGASWSRAGIVVWQLMQIAVAVGLFQGETARPDLGWALLVPSLVAIVLTFTKSVIEATARRN
ncbi:hypothetical protein FVA74_04345 [Salinibacterium sp. dk2585]|uniref:hypothetical protein n=1 Tax=unclassified Salinibacterium TaxID=2632331 RepID=UPI0011C24D05|nr:MULTISPECIES: hypothetical protein [unclassified Salinibacterium]QEE60895.1 hypothetical protein FVA74_04345 [Salinibacterium sp. dk2585]TXK55966.1 hypothetical protein FVP63_04490 [Salinibacterium sp. dk5596]